MREVGREGGREGGREIRYPAEKKETGERDSAVLASTNTDKGGNSDERSSIFGQDISLR